MHFPRIALTPLAISEVLTFEYISKCAVAEEGRIPKTLPSALESNVGTSSKPKNFRDSKKASNQLIPKGHEWAWWPAERYTVFPLRVTSLHASMTLLHNQLSPKDEPNDSYLRLSSDRRYMQVPASQKTAISNRQIIAGVKAGACQSWRLSQRTFSQVHSKWRPCAYGWWSAFSYTFHSKECPNEGKCWKQSGATRGSTWHVPQITKIFINMFLLKRQVGYVSMVLDFPLHVQSQRGNTSLQGICWPGSKRIRHDHEMQTSLPLLGFVPQQLQAHSRSFRNHKNQFHPAQKDSINYAPCRQIFHNPSSTVVESLSSLYPDWLPRMTVEQSVGEDFVELSKDPAMLNVLL